MGERVLRDVECRNAKPADKAYRLRDGGGLFLHVRPTGGKYWQYRYTRPDGKEGLLQIGPYPRISLEEARRRLNESRQRLISGVDPADARKTAKAERSAERLTATSFEACALAFIESHQIGWKNDKHARQWTSTLQAYAFPHIGPLRPDALTTEHILTVLRPIWYDKNETASRVRGRIEQILDWARVMNLREGENPARWRGHLDQLLPRPSKVQKPSNHDALPFSQIGQFILELRRHQGTDARLLEFTILTACRTGETLHATRREMDIEANVWTIPAERMKAGRAHRVPLSPAARALIDHQANSGNLIFEGLRVGRPLSNMAMLMLLRRMKRADITVHGFRSTFRDWAAENTAFQNEVVEMALAHSIGNKTEAAYRRGDLLPKRVELMAAWADYIERQVRAASKLPASGESRRQ